MRTKLALPFCHISIGFGLLSMVSTIVFFSSAFVNRIAPVLGAQLPDSFKWLYFAAPAAGAIGILLTLPSQVNSGSQKFLIKRALLVNIAALSAYLLAMLLIPFIALHFLG